MLKVVTSACLASVALLAAAATAGAASVPTNRNSADRAPYVTKGGPSRGSDTSAFSADAKHDGSSGHLPGSSFLARRTKTLVLALVPVASRAEAGTTANRNICVRGWHCCFWSRQGLSFSGVVCAARIGHGATQGATPGRFCDVVRGWRSTSVTSPTCRGRRRSDRLPAAGRCGFPYTSGLSFALGVP